MSTSPSLGVSTSPTPSRQHGVLRVVTALIQNHGQLDAALSVLDCGGGSGGLAVPVAELGANVTVVDISVDALATLNRRAAEAGVGERVSAVQGDIESLVDAVGSATFDLVLVHDVLGAVDYRAALASVATVVRPGGQVSVLIANPVAAVLSRILAGDLEQALGQVRAAASGAGPGRGSSSGSADSGATAAAATRLDPATLLALCAEVGLIIDKVQGVGVFAELLPAGIGGGGAGRDAGVLVAELEELAAGLAPYRDIAARVHVLARRPTEFATPNA